MEGARRIKRLGQAITILGGFAAVGLWIFLEVFLTPKVGPLEQLIGLLAIPMLPGGTLWALGWILKVSSGPVVTTRTRQGRNLSPGPVFGTNFFAVPSVLQ